MCCVVEEAIRVNMLAIDTRLEMQMFSSGTTRTTRQCNDVASLHMVALFYQILGVMTVIGFETVGVLDAHQIAIAIVIA